MAKRLQVILQDPEYREVQRAARSRHMSVAQWVRQALEMARRRDPLTDTDTKIAAVRAAVKHDFPTADIDQILAEIESGYHPGPAS
jgi:hypothetical protein